MQELDHWKNSFDWNSSWSVSIHRHFQLYSQKYNYRFGKMGWKENFLSLDEYDSSICICFTIDQLCFHSYDCAFKPRKFQHSLLEKYFQRLLS